MKELFNNIERFDSSITFTKGEEFKIILKGIKPVSTPEQISIFDIYPQEKMEVGKDYKITVKGYMTEKSSHTFDFMKNWNNDNPMPMVTMVGTVEKETRGMFFMSLHGQAEETCNCLHCGRKLTNKVSMIYGIGPVCGQHYGINPFNTEEELNEHFEDLKNQIANISWTGWVIKSAIKEWEAV